MLTITTTNNAASSTIGGGAALTGTAVGSGGIFATGTAAAAPVADPNSQATRASLVAQYNQVISEHQHHGAGFLVQRHQPAERRYPEPDVRRNRRFQAVDHRRHLQCHRPRSFEPDPGTDFLDNNSANNVLTSLTQASTTLRTEASALGSNLSVVQIRQDFNKNLINVLQTGASNLTLADTNEEAADSQALSTRQSIAVSALALANSRSRACCSCSADLIQHKRRRSGGGNPAAFLFETAGVRRAKTDAISLL